MKFSTKASCKGRVLIAFLGRLNETATGAGVTSGKIEVGKVLTANCF